MQRPVLANLVLEESAIRLLDILRQVGVEHKRRNLRVGQLRAILNLDILTLGRRWRRLLDDGQHHLVELRCAHMCLTVHIHLLGCFEHLVDAVLEEYPLKRGVVPVVLQFVHPDPEFLQEDVPRVEGAVFKDVVDRQELGLVVLDDAGVRV